jgi:hypothetical protein
MRTINTARADLSFDLIGVEGALIEVNVEFFPVAKLPIDMKASGSIGAGFHEFGEDLGAVASTIKSPVTLKDLPPGTIEIYKP